MKSRTIFYSTVLAACGVVSSPLCQSVIAGDTPLAAEAPAQPASHFPVDLARGSAGAKLQVRAPKQAANAKDDDENRSAQALIADDATLGYPLEPGTTSVLLTLPKIQVLSRFNFISYEAAGDVTISVSSAKLAIDSPDWKPLSKASAFSVGEVVACPLGSVDARYVKLDFNTKTAGRISNLGLFGLPKIGDTHPEPIAAIKASNAYGSSGFADVQNRNVFFDYANLYAGSSVAAVSHSGNVEQAQSILDGNPETAYTFDPTDPTPTVVVDLGVRRSVNRLSCVYEAPPGHLDVYLVDNPGKLTPGAQGVSMLYIGEPTAGEIVKTPDLDRPDLAKRKAIYSADTTGKTGINRFSSDTGGQTGRFLIAAFHPTVTAAPDFKDTPRDFKDTARDFKDAPHDFKDTARDFKDVPGQQGLAGAPAGTPFKVLAFSAFGDVPSGATVTRVPNPNFNPPGSTGGNNPNGGGTNPPFPEPPQGVDVATP